MHLTNENKHERISAQTRSESRDLRLDIDGAFLELGHGAKIVIGPKSVIRVAKSEIRGDQVISGDRPPRIQGQGQTTVIVWLSFRFDAINEEVLPFLEMSMTGVERIVAELEAETYR